MEIYRVLDYPLDKKIYDTNLDNYGKSFSSTHDHFLNSYFKVASKRDLPVDFLVSVNNQIAILGNFFIREVLSSAIVNDNYVDVYKVSRHEDHRNIIYPIELLNEFIQSLAEVDSFEPFLEGKYIWEAYFEFVRMNLFPECPNRKDSSFFFDSISSCDYYIETHREGAGKIYEVEIIECNSIFRGDMKFIDDLNVRGTHLQCIEQMFKYWNKETTLDPIFEYIFQGKYSLKPI